MIDKDATKASKKAIATLTDLTQQQLDDLSERYGGYPIDIWESRDHIAASRAEYEGLDIPPYWDENRWCSEMPPELFQRWQLLFWKLKQLPRHPASTRLSADFGAPLSFINKMRSHIARESVSRLPDGYVGMVRERQAFALERIVAHSMRKFFGETSEEDLDSLGRKMDSGGSLGELTEELTDKVKIDYGKLALAGLNQQAELLGTKAPKVGIPSVQMNFGTQGDGGTELAKRFNVDPGTLAKIGNRIAAEIARSKIEGPDADDAIDAEFSEGEP